MKLLTLGLLCIWSGLTSTRAGIIVRSLDDMKHEVNVISQTEMIKRSLEYPQYSNRNSKCHPQRHSSLEVLGRLRGNHRFHQKYSKENWKSSFQAKKHNISHTRIPQEDSNRVTETNIEPQSSKEFKSSKINAQKNHSKYIPEEVTETTQNSRVIDSVEVILRKDSNAENGRSKIKEIEINLRSHKAESIQSEDDISIEISANGLVKGVALAKASLGSEEDIDDRLEITDDYPEAEPRNPVLSNLSSPPSHRGFRTGIPDNQIEAQDSVSDYENVYL